MTNAEKRKERDTEDNTDAEKKVNEKAGKGNKGGKAYEDDDDGLGPRLTRNKRKVSMKTERRGKKPRTVTEESESERESGEVSDSSVGSEDGFSGFSDSE